MPEDAHRVSIGAEDGSRRDLGKVSTLCLGYGFHQAWVYASMFGTASVFGLPVASDGAALTPVFTFSVIFYALTLLVYGLFEQKVLSMLVRRRTASLAAVFVAAGTLLILPSGMEGAAGLALCVVSGILTGCGSATLIVFWGTAFARHSISTILLNTALAIVVAVAVYVVLLHLVPMPHSGVLAAALPFAELAVLWGHTPRSYVERHAVPLFNALPVNRMRFLAMMGLPMLLFGFVLGFMRLEAVVYMVQRIEIASQLPLLLSAGFAAVAIIVLGYLFINDERPNVLLRPLLPFVALSLLFVPLAQGGNITYSVIVMTGYMTFEGLVWILMGSMAQRFRISPVQIFGIARGSVGVGMLVAFALNPLLDTTYGIPGAEGVTTVVWMLVALVAAFALMPHVSDIRRAVEADEGVSETAIDAFNLRERTDGAIEEGEGASSSLADTREEGEEGKEGATAPEEDAAASGEGQGRGGLFRKKCERIADRYLLSAREAEVLFFLAKGHNAASIMEKLYISEGTAKTHIRHIYNKTDVHSQQELMKMVSDEWID